jgi:hypothetical protein
MTYNPQTTSQGDAVSEPLTIILVRDHVQDGEAAHPEDGERLAAAIIDRVACAPVSLDFTNVRGMNSAFSNAFFLALADGSTDKKLSISRISAINMTSFQQAVFERSRLAVMRRVAEEVGA